MTRFAGALRPLAVSMGDSTSKRLNRTLGANNSQAKLRPQTLGKFDLKPSIWRAKTGLI
jgi:hypothetical protein